ncbi:MAG: glycosyltransferase [Patescibacteria group bacterium]|uniref:Glycosyltransferase n=1 Tax=candidate division WWE3 bacterium TaxID=2053526 RepID=A0A955J2P5_UNCKA|nr:glycosyltransferase [candidate division WWE3 bacterium]
MKLAIIFDDLSQHGGAENLLIALSSQYPDAPVYAAFATPYWMSYFKSQNIKLVTSFMQRLPFKDKLNKIYAALMLHTLAYESFDLTDYDVVVSISARFAHGVITKPSTKHICYMNTPGRMLWEGHGYFVSYQNYKWFKRLKPYLDIFLSRLRLWDYTAAHRVDYFVANSKTPQNRIHKYYNRNSIIVYPFVEAPPEGLKIRDNKYLLLISRLEPWKRIEIAIKACNRLNVPLKIIGVGTHSEYLKSISGSTIEFLGRVTDPEKWEALANCSALIQTQYEDFGIVPLEAQAVGKPVIAYGYGGSLETVRNDHTGKYFGEQTIESVLLAIKNFEPRYYVPSACKAHASKFSKREFLKNMNQVINRVYLETQAY